MRISSKSGPSRRTFQIQCEALESRTLLAATALVKDINTATQGNIATPLGRLGSTVIFAQNDGVHGVELYKTDGTAAGTSMVKELGTGSADGVAVAANAVDGVSFGGAVYFASGAGGILSLWKTDGTAVGTTMVHQIAGSSFAQATDFTVTSTRIFFNVAPSGAGAKSLWVSDGTAAGTGLLSQVTGLPAMTTGGAIIANNKLYFTGENGSTGYFCVTDGTAAGSTILKSGSVTAQGVFSVGTKVMALAAGIGTVDIWTSDGSIAGTSTLGTYASIASFGSGPTHAYFIAEKSGENRFSLYSTNGTTAGTTLVLGNFTGARPGISILPNGSALFDATVNTVFFVYSSDGTASGTIPIGAIDTPSFGPFTSYNAGSVAVFAGFNGGFNNVALWKTDGTLNGTTTIPVSPIATAGPSAFLGGSPVYFSDDDGTHGQELWKTDGTAAGTSMIADVDQQPLSSNPAAFATINGKLWFDAYDSIHGYQPWTSDGTAAGTVQVSTDPFSTFPDNPFVGLGTKAFTIGNYNGVTTRLYYSTGVGVTQAANASGQPSVGVALPTLFNNAVYMVGSDGTSYGIWKTDGTQAGTSLAATTSVAKFASNMVASGNFLYFDGKINGVYEIYSMSTSGVVTQLTNLASPTPLMSAAVAFNNKFYYLLTTNIGVQLWQSDGTATGTTFVDEVTNSSTSAYQMLATNGVLYILAGNGGLYKSDGTAAGTTLLTSSLGVISPVQMAGANGNLYFTAADPNGSNIVPWFTDGTTANTRVLMPNQFSDPHIAQLTSVGSRAYFIATDSVHGSELWQTDGTVAGTQVIDIIPGAASGIQSGGTPGPVVGQLGSALFVGGNDGIHGTELLRIYNQDTINGTAAVDTITLTQDTTHNFINWQMGGVSGQLPITDPAGLTINGNGSTDVINLIATNGNPLPATIHFNGTFTLNGLTGTNPLANTALDINASTLFITYAGAAADPLSMIRSYLSNGYNNGLWNGLPTPATGVIRSAAAANNASKSTAVGYVDSAEGLVALPANTIELKYTLYGDTGLTGTVGFTDFMRMTQRYTLAGQTWAKGDFNYDGNVNATDFNLLQPNFGQTLPAPSTIPSVAQAPAVSPAPSTVASSSPDPGSSDQSTTSIHRTKKTPPRHALHRRN